MEKTELLVIFPTFENLDVVKKTLPTIISEVKRNNAKLLVHDSSVKMKKEKWDWLQKINKNGDFFLILSDNMSMAHSRNMCLHLGQELYAPDYICMVEDDHGFHEGLIKNLLYAMKKYYGSISPNGLRYGLFTACGKHHHSIRGILEDGNAFPTIETRGIIIGSANSCFRCAPTSHWNNVLKGYDTDEYLISTYQTKNLNFRNYNKGFTIMIVGNGNYCFDIDFEGRGTSSKTDLKLWDENYTASDPRSNYLGKSNFNKYVEHSNIKFENHDKINLKTKIKNVIKGAIRDNNSDR